METNDNVAADADDAKSFERFTRRLIGLARSHLDTRLQHKIDPKTSCNPPTEFLLRTAKAPWRRRLERLVGMLMVITLRVATAFVTSARSSANIP